jgi:hypothetical protein
LGEIDQLDQLGELVHNPDRGEPAVVANTSLPPEPEDTATEPEPLPFGQNLLAISTRIFHWRTFLEMKSQTSFSSPRRPLTNLTNRESRPTIGVLEMA